ncbi:MAG TPA: hydroxymethylpyrimidine/phosphomethylpyrimidine kinase [Pyrinomonadaceae bacterium]|nr:hydroxymethylpyrimidine/phosphomethylpyrimidine kinase [Pyrinomonadaceae bacterium]
MASPNSFPVALTIAGFDPSGGAGVLADLRTFAAFGLHSSAAITSLTFQTRTRVYGAEHQNADTVRAQVIPLFDEYKIVCAKVGMLPTREVVRQVAQLFRELDLPSPVLDPVIISTSGQRLMEEDAVDSLVSELLPLVRLITPNISEAEHLTGISITSESEMRQAAAMIRGLGAEAVLIKGGHLGQEAGGRRQEAERSGGLGPADLCSDSIDVLDDEGRVTVFREPRIPGGALRGSGCILSAAVAAGLGKGQPLEDSVRHAKTFVWEAIRRDSLGSS